MCWPVFHPSSKPSCHSQLKHGAEVMPQMRVHYTGTKKTLMLKPYSNATLMCKEQQYPGVDELTGKLTNDSAWADVHLWEFSFLSSLMDPEGLFLRVEQLQHSNFGSEIDAAWRQWRCAATFPRFRGRRRRGGCMSSAYIGPSIVLHCARLAWKHICCWFYFNSSIHFKPCIFVFIFLT